MAHVAAAGEEKGRVVLQLGCSPTANPVAVAAAVRIARAFGAEVESLFVENRQLIDLAGFRFATEVAMTGTATQSLDGDTIARQMATAFSAQRRHVEHQARRAGVPVRFRLIRGEPVVALASTCAASGPWNMVVMAEPFGRDGAEFLGSLFDSVWDTTGFVLVGPKARRSDGPVIVAVEDLDRLPAMLRTAERLAAQDGAEPALLLIAETPSDARHVEDQIRYLLAGSRLPRLVHSGPTYGEPACVAEILRRARPGFIIARYGGLAVPAEDLGPLSTALECPLLVVR